MTACWPYEPQGMLVEALEWSTDVHRTIAREYRRSRRVSPRQEWQHEYKLDAITHQEAVALARSLMGEEFDLPIWPERTSVGAIAHDTISLPVDATYACYSEAGSLFIWEDNDTWEVVDIASIGEGSISLASGVVGDYAAAWVMPVRRVRFMQGFDLDPQASESQWCIASARFQAVVTEDLFEVEPLVPGYTTFKGYPVLLPRAQMLGSMRQTSEQVLDTLDSTAGLVSDLPVVEQPVQQGAVAWTAYTAETAYAMRLWLHHHKGQWKCFWVPSWSDDVELVSDIHIDDTTVEIADIDLDEHGEFPMDIIMWESGWPRVMRAVSAAAGDGSTQLLTLEAASVIDIVAANVSKSCRMRLCRFATDRLEIQHLVGVQASLYAQVVEVPAIPVAAGEGYDEHDWSEEDSSPVYLFHFVQGSVNYRYTSLGESFVALGSTWDPAVIVPAEFKISGDRPKDGLTLQLPRDNPLALTFLGYPPEVPTTLVVYRCDYYDDSAPIVYWTGQVMAAPGEGNVVNLTCESDFAALDQLGPKQLVTRLCPYVHYGRGCNLVEASFGVSATVVGVTGATVTLSAPPAARYAGGTLKTPDGVKLTIWSHASGSATMIMLYKSKSLRDQLVAHPAGFSVTLYPACNRTLYECENTYGNKGNHGGSFGIPTENPTNKV